VVVHHGGAGTTAAGFRAGIPQVIIPHMQDQPYWGQKVQQVGAGPRPIPRRKLTVSALADAIRLAVGDPALRERARQIGAAVRAEDGLERAIRVIERYFEN
jgi:sterol 3beta-glucosyltransferase